MDYKKIAYELKAELQQQFGIRIKDVILFGSALSGRSTPDSDVDILIIVNGDYDYHFKKQINDICYEFDLKYEIFIDTQIISENEMKSGIRGKHPVFRNAVEKGFYV